MNPSDVPEGASPDCAENRFVPGAVLSRGCFQKRFAAPLYPNANRVYGKSMVAPDLTVRNLYFYDNGAITIEDVSVAPGVETLLAFSTASCKMKSITAFGREYIAISDGLHGQEVPLQLSFVNGVAQLDRLTQDGPGASPTVANLIIAASQMAGSGNTMVRLNNTVTVQTATPHSLLVGYLAQITGVNATAVGGGIVSVTIDNEDLPGIATVTTGAPHGLLPQNQVSLTGVANVAVGGGIASIVRQSGITTVTTVDPHGIVPGSIVTISSSGTLTITGATNAIPIVFTVTPNPETLGFTAGTVFTVSGATPGQYNGTFTITKLNQTSITADNTGAPGSAWVSGGTIASTVFNTTATVLQVTSPTTFTYADPGPDGSGSAGTVTLNWIVPDSPTPFYYTVVSSPTPTTFQVAVNYADGTWTGGTVSFAWDGPGFYVASVPTTTSFTYQQYGPNATTTDQGTVTPFGQAAPGLHQIQVSFLDRNGGITAPSPPVQFEANGGQYLQITNLPIGPSPEIVGRIIEFTGAEGADFFYIPATPIDPQTGQIVGTATQVNDNTTTSLILDFSDPTLFLATGISIPGNELANQIVLDSALGFGFYNSRLLAWGQRNIIQGGDGAGGFLNLGFDGGFLASAPTLPLGWTVTGGGGSLAAGHFGQGWEITATAGGAKYGQLSQAAYLDAYGDPIADGNTQYTLRLWLQPSSADAGLNFVAAFSSASTGFSITATINGAAMNPAGGWVQAQFSGLTPDAIPSDMLFSIWATSSANTVTLLVDEINIVYTAQPFTNDCLASYPDNPSGMDGVSGVFGADDDTRKPMEFFIIRKSLYLLTQDPAGRLHLITATANTQPAGWEADEIASMCGLVSAFALTKSQAADDTASGGEEFAGWLSTTGAQIFSGNAPVQFSIEIQSDPVANPYGQPDMASINTAAQLTAWALNDPDATVRTIYFGIPTGNATTPNLILPMSYIGLESAEAIADSPAVHLNFSGKLITRDTGRKWTRWNRPMNYAALMYTDANTVQSVFMGGATAAGKSFGNCYILNSALQTDDDYGVVAPYYTSCGIPTRDQELQYQLGSMMKELAYLTQQITWTGVLTIQPLINNLATPAQWAQALAAALKGQSVLPVWPISLKVAAVPYNPTDLEWGGGQATGQRIFLRFSTAPLAGQTDNGFSLTALCAVLKQNARLPVTGRFG